MFKEYTKQYEDVFTSEGAIKACDLTSVDNLAGMTNVEYMKLTKSVMAEISDRMFEDVVKMYWLERMFTYKKKRKKKLGSSGIQFNNAYATFTRHYLGMNIRILTDSFYFGKTFSYFNDFFPEFDARNPFTDKEYFKFPYKNITVDFLSVVYQMPERLDLLRIAEERKFSYAQFLDYVINYVFCFSEENEGVYTFLYNHNFPPYVKYNKKAVKKPKL